MPVTPAVSAPSSRAVFPLPPIETPPAPPGSPAQVAAMPAAPAPRVPPTATTPTPVQASRADSTADAVARAALQAGTAGMVLDHAVLDELRTVLGAEIDRLVSVFLEEVPQQIIKLEAAALGPDFTVLHDIAHSLKSASANVGAMALSTAAKRVELGARMRTLDRPAVAVALVAREFDRARFALRCAVRKASIGV
jgi:HPt (histidine-containing phosphotransfer) domain-containing protein